MKKYGIFVLLLFSLVVNANSQTFTQTFIDKCSGERKIATTVMINGNATVSFYDQMRSFTPFEVQTGLVQVWLNTIKTTYEAITCPIITNPVIQQTVANTATQATTSVASQVAGSAASSMAPTTNESSVNENTTASETDGSADSSEQKSESKDEKKENKKKEKSAPVNPILLSSDLSTIQTPGGKWLQSVTVGVSKSSLMGDESYSANTVIMSDLNTFIVSGGYTKMDFFNGKLNAVHSYSTSIAYLGGNYMNLIAYTWIKPSKKYGMFGYNLSLINLFLKDFNGGYDHNVSTSVVAFWTKPYQYNKKLSVSPQVFTMLSPISWNSMVGTTTINRNLGYLLGVSFDYKISKRFGFSLNYRLSGNTTIDTPFLNNILIGSRMLL